MKIIIVGCGKLAGAIVKKCDKETIPCSIYPEVFTDTSDIVILHAGSGREQHEALEFAQIKFAPFIQLATDTDPIPNVNYNIPVLLVPNADMQNLRLYRILKDSLNKRSKNINCVKITESYQERKFGASEVAKFFLNTFRLNKIRTTLESVREPQKQLELGISQDFLNNHSYHKVTIDYFDHFVSYETKAYGLESYACGAIVIAAKILHLKEIAKGLHQYKSLNAII